MGAAVGWGEQLIAGELVGDAALHPLTGDAGLGGDMSRGSWERERGGGDA